MVELNLPVPSVTGGPLWAVRLNAGIESINNDYVAPAGKTDTGPTAPAPIFNVKDFGAVGNNASDDTVEIQACVDAAALVRGAVFFPDGTYRISGQIDIPESMHVFGQSMKTTLWFYQGNASGLYGLNVEGPGLGGANQDGTIIERLSVKGNAKALIGMFGVANFRIRNIISQNSQSPTIHIDTCQDAAISDIDMYSTGLLNALGTTGTGGNPEGAGIFVNNSNMIYLNMIRMESPRSAAVYVKESSNIKWMEGKVDGGGSSTPSHDPFCVSDDASLFIQNVNFHGFENIPMEIRGSGIINCDNVIWSNGTAQSLFRATTTTQTIWPTDTQPGHKALPSITVRNSRINVQAFNDPDKLIQSLVYSIAPDPLYRYYSEPLPMNLTSTAWASGNAYRQGVLRYSNGAGGWIIPAGNDRYVGAWLVHKQTGKKVRVWQNFSDTGIARLDMGANTLWNNLVAGDFPNGEFYQLEVNAEDGVEVVIDNLKLGYRRRLATSVFTLAFHTATVTVNSSAYNATTFRTDVTLSAAADAGWVGQYIRNSVTNKDYLIRAVSGSVVSIDYDRASELTAGTWHIRAGKVKGVASFDGGTLGAP